MVLIKEPLVPIKVNKGLYPISKRKLDMTTLTQITVPFHNAELYLVEHDGQPYTPMKPIVEGMGLAWQSQLAKLNANPQRWGITKIVIPTLGDLQEMVCLPLRKTSCLAHHHQS